MDNKEIQKQRMMRYFIDAAKDIIREEGVKGVTARKVGKRAGYSYATIYNYFNDLNILLTHCCFDFFEDCYNYMISFKQIGENSKEQLINCVCAYFKYFVENPSIFELIFLEELGDLPKELMKSGKYPLVRELLKKDLRECVRAGYILEENIEMLQDLIPSLVVGKLIFFLKKRNTKKIEGMLKVVRREIEFILSK